MVKAGKRQADKDISSLASPRKSKARKVKVQFAASTATDSASSEEDVAHLQSQQFLQQAKQALKKKAVKQNDGYAKMFEVMVEEKKQALLPQLEQRASQYLAQRTTGQEAVKSILSDNLVYTVFIPLHVALDTKPTTHRKATPHPLQQKASSLINLSKELLGAYDKVSQDLVTHELSLRQVGQDWEGDCQKLQHLLEVGKNTTGDKVRALTVEDGADLEECDAMDKLRDRQTWTELAGVKREDDGRDSWAATVRKMERGVVRLAKCLTGEYDG